MTHRVVTDYTRVENSSSNIKVFVRARPLEDPSAASDFLSVDSDDPRKLSIKDPDVSNRKYGEVNFQFDRVFWTEDKQTAVFEEIIPQVDHILNGYNSCCFAYGQTGSGKTYSMFGAEGEIRGLIPRAVEYLFSQLATKSSTSEVAMVCSFLEIYNDQIRDLGKAYLVAMGVETSTSIALYEKTSDIFESLAGKRGNPYFAPVFHKSRLQSPASPMAGISASSPRPGLKEVQDEYNTMNYEIREDTEGSVFVKDLSLIPVTTIDEVMSLIAVGLRVRATHETKMNATSSRSHTVFTINVLQKDLSTDQAISGMLNLVDLAGSERLKKSESQGVRLKEALHINTSLTALGKVVMALDPSTETTHVPYRDSKLTRLLQNSLGGNSFTTVLAAIHPNPSYYDECLSTLQFANRCRNVRNNPRVNYVNDNEDKDRKIRRLMDEITTLRAKCDHAEQGALHTDNALAQGLDITPAKLVAILKKLGISATMSEGGLVVNGKKVAAGDLKLDTSSTADQSQTSSNQGNASKDKGNLIPEKARLQIKDLQEANASLSAKGKDRKVLMEEQGKQIQELSSELVKSQTINKHKDHQIACLKEENERCVKDVQETLAAKHLHDMSSVLAHNTSLLANQQSTLQHVPDTFRTYTLLIKKAKEMKFNFEGPIRLEFERHLTTLEQSRIAELEHIKQQYEHWLHERDNHLQDFVNRFNVYRTKKSEQLRLCEKEIVTLFAYTEQIEAILDAVERGEYQVRQKQGIFGKSTTGLLNAGTAGGGTLDGGHMGAIVLPNGLRPPSLLLSTDNNALGLSKRIINKHKQRELKLEKVKEDAFQQSIHLATTYKSVAALGPVDPVLEKQVRDLLIMPGAAVKKSGQSGNALRSQSATVRPSSAAMGFGATVMDQSPNQMQNDDYSPANVTASVRPSSAAPTVPRREYVPSTNYQPQAPDMTSAFSAQFMCVSSGSVTGGSVMSLKDKLAVSQEEIAELRGEIEALQKDRALAKINVAQVTKELASNETLQYVQTLEQEQDKLRRQVKEMSAQLLSTKTANASLQRKLEKNGLSATTTLGRTTQGAGLK